MGIIEKPAAKGQPETYLLLGALGSPRLSPELPCAGTGLSDSCCSQVAQKLKPCCVTS